VNHRKNKNMKLIPCFRQKSKNLKKTVQVNFICGDIVETIVSKVEVKPGNSNYAELKNVIESFLAGQFPELMLTFNQLSVYWIEPQGSIQQAFHILDDVDLERFMRQNHTNRVYVKVEELVELESSCYEAEPKSEVMVSNCATAPPAEEGRNTDIQAAIQQMMSMGYDNTDGWLTSVLEEVNGEVDRAVEFLQQPEHRL
jgi:hypothetical protein